MLTRNVRIALRFELNFYEIQSVRLSAGILAKLARREYFQGK